MIILSLLAGICISKSLKIPRDVRIDTFNRLLHELREPDNKAKVVVMFVNEDNCRQLVNATIALHLTDAFYWLASDSWGAKTVPVDKQERAAEGTVTILPQREVIHGMCNAYFFMMIFQKRCMHKCNLQHCSVVKYVTFI